MTMQVECRVAGENVLSTVDGKAARSREIFFSPNSPTIRVDLSHIDINEQAKAVARGAVDLESFKSNVIDTNCTLANVWKTIELVFLKEDGSARTSWYNPWAPSEAFVSNPEMSANIRNHLLTVALIAYQLAKPLEGKLEMADGKIFTERDTIRTVAKALLHDIGKVPEVILKWHRSINNIFEAWDCHPDIRYAEFFANINRWDKPSDNPTKELTQRIKASSKRTYLNVDDRKLVSNWAKGLANCGHETGHECSPAKLGINPKGRLIVLEHDWIRKLVAIADYMGHQETTGENPRSAIVASTERFVYSELGKKYPHILNQGLGITQIDDENRLVNVPDVKNVQAEVRLIGSYAEIHQKLTWYWAKEYLRIVKISTPGGETELQMAPEILRDYIISRYKQADT